MPNLLNLKKRAKTLLRQHRDGYYSVAVRLRRGLPRFHTLDDQAILAAPFALGDALDVIARENGFDAWVLATKELSKMQHSNSNPAQETPTTRLLAAYPQILVSDMRRAVAFYTGTLGFRVTYLYGEPPFYGLVERDGAALNLRHVDDPKRYQAPESEQVLAANIPTEGTKALFLDLDRRGADFAHRLKEQPWGTQDFIVRDPDGNLLCFAEAASPPS